MQKLVMVKARIKSNKIPNEVTMKTFEDTDKGKNLVKRKSAKAMFRKLGL